MPEVRIASNWAIGEIIGVTHAAVSRIRSGNRRPSWDLMLRIEQRFGWSFMQQCEALYGDLLNETDGTSPRYAEAFDRHLGYFINRVRESEVS